MKNTMGYMINAFLDFDSSKEILAHLMVGSEGTLGVHRGGHLPHCPGLPTRVDATAGIRPHRCGHGLAAAIVAAAPPPPN